MNGDFTTLHDTDARHHRGTGHRAVIFAAGGEGENSRNGVPVSSSSFSRSRTPSLFCRDSRAMSRCGR